MRVIGTAGHVDHGKSALIEALTGTHPDRLQEERNRGLTIVLGFSWLTLPNGESIGIVDVPGHRDFIENMLSGVGAIDAALFVVAADEGVMPQTREHLAILDLLQIQGGVVALTKIDLIDDPEWLDLVEADLMETLAGTVLDSAPLVRVSSRTGEGIPELLDTLGNALTEKPPRPDLGRPRLSVDRTFIVSGFGTVVTGTLTDGHLKVGDDIVVLPHGREGRVRGLQTHQHKIDIAVPGSRTAINISGVDADQIQRGDVIAHPGDYKSTRRIDVHFRLLSDASQAIEHNTEMKLFIGAAERMTRVRLLGAELLEPGHEGWLQLEMVDPLVAMRGDRYILRRPSPGETIGGGSVVDSRPQRRHKRFDQRVLDRFEALAGGAPTDIILQALLSLGAAPLNVVIDRASLDQDVADQALGQVIESGQAILLEGQQSAKSEALIVSREYLQQFADRAEENLTKYHHNFPLRRGIPREELKSRLKVSARVFDAMLQRLIEDGCLKDTYLQQNLPGMNPVPVVFHPDHSVNFTTAQQKDVGCLLEKFEAEPHSPPTIKECVDDVGGEVYNALIDLEKLIPVSGEVVFRRGVYDAMVEDIKQILGQDETTSVAKIRDHFATSRRYALALLEHLDSIGLTVRIGNVRKLKAK